MDHKTTPSSNKNEDHVFQMGCYAWLVSLYYPGYQIKTVIHYAHPSLNFYGAPDYWSSEELTNVEAYILNQIYSVENYQEFPALPGDSCDYCHMVQECPINLALVEQRARGPIDLNVKSHEDLQRVAKQLRTVGMLYDELNKTLKKAVDTYAAGRVDIDGWWYGNKVSDESIDWIATDLKIREEHARAKALLAAPPPDMTPEQRRLYEKRATLPDLGAILQHWQIDPNTFREWQGQKLKNIWRLDKPGLIDELKQFVVKDRSTRWGGYKT
jgi:hypothetical protein